MKTEHKTIEELLVYLENPIGVEEDGTIEDHLSKCDKCVSDLGFLDSLRAGMKNFSRDSGESVKTGLSVHLTNREISGYINDACNDEEKKNIILHLAGCSSCLDDVFAVKRLTTQLEHEASLAEKSYLVSRFIMGHPTRMGSIEKEGKDLIQEAARVGIAIFDIGRSLSFSFEGAQDSKTDQGEEYRKMETEDFTIEIVRPAGKESNVTIGVLAKDNLASAKITICAEEEKSEIIPLENRRAVINKKDIQAEAIRYIKIEKV